MNHSRDKHKKWKGAQGIAEDVRYYGQWMRDEAEKRIGHLYPKARLPDGSEATVIAWLWARTVRSPDPAARGAMVPLVSSFMLSTKEGKKAWAETVIDPKSPDGWRFEVRTGRLSKDREKELKQGTIGRSNGGTCILSGASMPFSYVREQGQENGLGVRLMAIVAEGNRQRIYLSPSSEHEEIALKARPDWEPEGELPHNPRDFKTPNYGLTTFASLFTPRQLVALTTFSDLVLNARELILQDALKSGRSSDPTSLSNGGDGATAYADAVSTYLAFLVSRASDYGSSISTWLTDDNAIRSTFGRQAIPMTWDYCEGSFFGDSSASWATIIKTTTAVIEHQQATSFGSISAVNAPDNNYPVPACLINTDPPYYDNIGYADLSDFFFIWLRRSLNSIWPELFRRLATPKAPELVATPYRHGGKEAAEAFFMEGMGKALSAMRRASVDDAPLAIYYAFKQSEAEAEGLTSAGWSSFLQAVVDAGLVVDGTWPMRTESAGRLIGRGANALASSIVLVCRKRDDDAATITRSDFLRQLRRELPEAIAAIRAAGVGPVDMQQSVIGPGMGVFSRQARVLEDDDSPMPVKTALALINRVWEEIEQDLDAAFDAATQVALAWYATYGFDPRPSGEAIVLAQAKNTALNTLFDSGVFQNLHGRVALTEREKLPDDWTPEGDKSLTVWECVQHTARVLMAEDGGSEAAAKLVAGMGPSGDQARALAYRLFEIATNKGWSQEALVYNELAQEWPRLQDAAGVFAAAVPRQGTLDL